MKGQKIETAEKGVFVTLIQTAYMDNCGEWYRAGAIHDDGERYNVWWKINNPEGIEDYEMCDWEDYSIEKQ